uniref:Uncharacterized protein n=1 Tax=Acrobeloides nanus TaxID=290746 RepID=A0A914DUD4_9BILA
MPRGKLSYGDSRLKNFDPKVVRRLPCFLPAKPLCAFVNALIDGNDEFDQLMIEITKTKLVDVKIEAKNRPLAMKPDEILLGVEDAINLMGSGMHRVQESDVFENFYTDLKNVLSHAFRQIATNETLAKWKQFFFLLGAKDHCVLLVYQPVNKTIVFIDPSKFEFEDTSLEGAVIAMASSVCVDEFCQFVTKRYKNAEFRLTWIAQKKKSSCASFDPKLPENTPKLFKFDSTQKL